MAAKAAKPTGQARGRFGSIPSLSVATAAVSASAAVESVSAPEATALITAVRITPAWTTKSVLLIVLFRHSLNDLLVASGVWRLIWIRRRTAASA